MVIEKRFKGETEWKEESEKDCLDRTEGSGYWKSGTVLKMLEEGLEVFTAFAIYRKKNRNRKLSNL